MNNRQIECFLEAGRLLNFTRAAENLLLPQPAVSRYISALEEELGVKLFLRKNSRSIVLTEAGKAYYNLFQRVEQELHRTKQSLANTAPTLRLGINKSWRTTDFLPDVIEACRRRDPQFRVIYTCLDFKELRDGLQSKQLDAVIALEDYLTDAQEFAVERITSIQRVILFSDRLPGADLLRTPTDFYPYDFLITDDPLVRKLAEESERIFHAYRFVPRFRNVPNQETVLCYVENGEGVALLDTWCHALYHPHLRAVHIDEYMPVALACRRDQETAAAELFRECLCAFFQKRADG